MRLRDKVAIVTGGASGMGRATALCFAAEGAKMVVADVDGEGCEETSRLVRKLGTQSYHVKADVSVEADVRSLVRIAVEKFGRLDIMFNNAGVRGKETNLQDVSVENWEAVLAVNLRGVFLGMKHAIPQMLAQGSGAIVNTASTAGVVGYPGLSAYCASKGGVVSLTRSAAMELAPKHIRVNCICPGPILTQMTERVIHNSDDPVGRRKAYDNVVPMLRMGTPEEIASVALFLASDDSSFITGAILPVDGGVTVR